MGWRAALSGCPPARAGVRYRALRRQQALVALAAEALRQVNRVWAEVGTFAPREADLAAQMDQAEADFRWHRTQSLEGPVEAFYLSGPGDPAEELLYAPYAVLSLRWEASYPHEWGARESWMWSPWTGKEIRQVAAHPQRRVTRASWRLWLADDA